MITSNHICVLMFSCLTVLSGSSAVCAENTAPANTKASSASQTLVWHDCKEIGIDGKGWTNTQLPYDRLPASAQGEVAADIWNLGHRSAGLCVRFTTDAPSIQVRWTLQKSDLAMPHMPATGVSGVDLYVKRKGEQWRFSRQWAAHGRIEHGTPSRCLTARHVCFTCRCTTA